MKNILLLFTIILLYIISFTGTYAIKLETPNIEKIYNNFIKKVEKQYKGDKEIEFLKKLNTTIYSIMENRKLNNAQIILLNDLIKLTNEKLFSIDYSNKSKKYTLRLNNYSISSGFKYKPKNDDFIFLENSVWYYYNYAGHLSFKKGVNISDRDLSFNKIYKDKTIVYLAKDGNLGYIVDFQKIRLINDDIIYGVTDKYNFLKELKDDKKKLYKNTDSLFQKLKNKTLELTSGKTREQKIKAIYNYVIDNIEYPTQVDLNDYTIFSGIAAYEFKKSACEGYSKMFMYMLNFAGIGDTTVIRGYVIDSKDFPRVGHAWVKVGNDYYDPTFDDPVGGIKTKTYSEYKYYNLPKDLFYTNRYKYENLPKGLRNIPLINRENIVENNLSNFVSKYSNKNYNLLKPFKFRQNNNLGKKEKITLSNFNKILPLYNVVDFKFRNINGKNYTINGFSYFILTNDGIENLLRQLKYDLTGYFFFKWSNPDGSYDYRLGYNVKFN